MSFTTIYKFSPETMRADLDLTNVIALPFKLMFREKYLTSQMIHRGGLFVLCCGNTILGHAEWAEDGVQRTEADGLRPYVHPGEICLTSAG